MYYEYEVIGISFLSFLVGVLFILLLMKGE